MKRSTFLACAGLDAPRFKLLKQRGQLPFTPKLGPALEDLENELAHANYSLSDALQMRVFLDATGNKGLSIEAAQYIGGNCLRHLVAASGQDTSGGDLWIFYAQGRPHKFADTGDYMTPRALGVGRLTDLPAFVEEKVGSDETQFVALINASAASLRVLTAALELDAIAPDEGRFMHVWEREYQIRDTEDKG